MGVGVWAGCAAPHSEANDTLRQPVAVQAAAPGPGSLRFTIAGGPTDPQTIELVIAAPRIELHTMGDRAQLDAVDLPLGDLTVSATALPPHGLVLRHLLLKAGPAHAEIVHAQDDALELRAHVPLALDWSVELDDGSFYPLGQVRTDPLDVDVQVVRVGTHATLTVAAACAGTCWSAPGLATLSDGAMQLQADAEVTAAR